MKTFRQTGFTLIELMIVVVIVAILAGIAYPNYTRYIIETRRADGQGALLELAGRLEKYYTNCSSYTMTIAGGNISACTGLGTMATSRDLHYNLTVVAGGTGNIADSYQIRATPAATSSQAGDTDCMTLTLEHTGAKGQTGPNTSGRCWRR